MPTQSASHRCIATARLAKNDVKEDYVLVIDADMIMREPFTPEVSSAACQCTAAAAAAAAGTAAGCW